VSWDVFFTETAEQWLDALSDEDFDRVIAAADLLSDRGPGSGGRRSTRSPPAATRT